MRGKAQTLATNDRWRWAAVGALLVAANLPVALPVAVAQDQGAAKRSTDADWAALRMSLDLEEHRARQEKYLAAALKRGGPMSLGYARELSGLADLDAAVGRWREAVAGYQQSLQIQQAAGGRPNARLETLSSLANVYLELAEYRQAHDCLAECQQILKTAEPFEILAPVEIKVQIAELLLQMGDWEGAEAAYKEALAASQTQRRTGSSDLCLHNLGLLAQRRGNLDEAFALLQQDVKATAASVERLPDEGNRYNHAHSLSTLAFVEKLRGDYAQAEKDYLAALETLKSVAGPNHPLTIRTSSNLGALYTATGEYAKAEALLGAAAAARKKIYGGDHLDVADSLNDLARMHLAAGNAARAVEPALEAVRITRLNLDLTAAAQSERQQLAMMQQFRDRLDTLLSIGLAGGIAPDRLWDEILHWKGSIFGRQRQLHKLWNEPELGPILTALQNNSRQFARLALTTPDEPAEWLEIRQQLNDEREALEQQLAQKLGGIALDASAPPVNAAAIAGQLPPEAALIDYLEFLRWKPATDGQPQAAPVRELAAFVVRPGKSIVLVGLGPVEPIAAAATEWREAAFAPPRPGISNAPSARLRELLLQPLDEQLAGVSTLLVSPDGVMSSVPFAALPGKQAGQYLIEEQAVAVVPVPRLLGQALSGEGGSADGLSLLVVGEVDFDATPGLPAAPSQARSATRAGRGFQWQALPATREEVVSIRDSFETAFEEGSVRSLRAGKATEEALRQSAGKNRFVHMATHGFFAPDLLLRMAPEESAGDGDTAQGEGDAAESTKRASAAIAAIRESAAPDLLTGLVLAGANQPPASGQDDGILTALEVKQLDLNHVELATLSACQTGLGTQASGEGVLGLQRAFQVAGAQSVVSSLWEVDDEATRALMVRFYENLWTRKESKLEALRDAQLWMLKERGSRGLQDAEGRPASDEQKRLPPYYWAAFVLSGDWR